MSEESTSTLEESTTHRLLTLAADPTITIEERLERLVKVGSERLGTENGHLVRIDADAGRHDVILTAGSDIVQNGVNDLNETYCVATIEDSNGLLHLHNAPEQGWESSQAYQRFGINTYIGGKLHVSGTLYGTLCYVSEAPRVTPFTDEDITFFELLSGVVARTLERRRLRDHHEALIEHAVDGMFLVDVVPEDRFVYRMVTSEYANIVGRSSSTVAGSTPVDVHGESLGRRIERKYRACVDHASALDYELERTTEDGATFWRTKVAPIVEAGEVVQLVGSTRDITDRKERLIELETTKTRFRALTENTNLVVIVIDANSKVHYVNDAVQDIFGYAPDELIGKSLLTIMPERRHEEHLHAVQRYLETGEKRLDWEWIELPGLHRNGTEVPLGIIFGETSIDGEPRFTAVIRDITDRKRRRQELELTKDELERSNEQLEQFASGVSHDLKEPLRTVSSHLDLLRRRLGEDLNEEVQESLDEATDGIERMRSMIQGLLESSRLQTNDTRRESVDPNDALRRAIDNLEVRIEESCTEVHVEELPTVVADEAQLTQVFQNLVKNAIDHGGPSPTIRITAEKTSEAVEFSVSDDGPGIPSGSSDRIFDMFMTGTDSNGTGIGLTICRQIVDLHDGEIWVDDESSEGTTVSFSIPLKES